MNPSGSTDALTLTHDERGAWDQYAAALLAELAPTLAEGDRRVRGAKLAAEYADAMIVERRKRGTLTSAMQVAVHARSAVGDLFDLVYRARHLVPANGPLEGQSLAVVSAALERALVLLCDEIPPRFDALLERIEEGGGA